MENNDEMEFREWLQSAMGARGIGPSDLARMSKVPQPTIFRILSGETKDPRTGTVKRLERALGVSSPPIDDADAAHHKIVAEFAWVYRNATPKGREFLRIAIGGARAAYLENKPVQLSIVKNDEDEAGA